MAKSLSRNIHFFRADAGLDESHRPVPVDVRDALIAIGGLDWKVGQRYVEQADGNVLTCWVDLEDQWPRLKLATVRRADWPLVENAGVLSQLPLQPRDGLCESIHIVFFPNHIVGFDSNFYGPRSARVGWYLKEVARAAAINAPDFTLFPLLRRDVAQQLSRFGQIRVLDWRSDRPTRLSSPGQANYLGAAFQAATRAGRSERVGLILGPEPHRRGWLTDGIRNAARSLAGQPDLRENVWRFTVRGLNDDSHKMEQVDLLRDHLIAQKQVVKLNDNTRAIDDRAAYAAVEEAYLELGSELESAAAVEALPH